MTDTAVATPPRLNWLRHRWLLPAAVWLLGALVFFRAPIFSGFDTITGDEGDARLIVYLHEHWWQVLKGDHGWRDPPIFYPTHDVLSYSDTFVLNQVLYLPLRTFGVSPLVAFQLCLIALTAVGFTATYVLLRRHLALPAVTASLLSAVVAFANNLYVDTPHAQLFSVCIVPVIVLLAVEAWLATERGAGLKLAFAAGALLGLLLWSNFYFGWFAVVVALIAAGVGTVLLLISGQVSIAARQIAARWQRLLAALAGLVLLLVPFLLTYAPALSDDRSRSYDEVAGLAPTGFDMVNVGRDNVAWGWLLRKITGDNIRLQQLNRATAVTPLLLASTGLAAVWLIIRWRRQGASARSLLGITTAVTTFVVVVLPIQFGFGGVWAWLHRFMPGGSAIRVYARIEVVNVLVAVLAVACALSVLGRAGRRTGWLIVLPLLFCFEQLNTSDAYRELDRSHQLDMFDVVTVPPPSCEVFWIVPAPNRNPDHASIDAMLISQRWRLPTVNGYSGWTPDGWNLQPGAEGYDAAVQQWLDTHDLADQACAYDVVAQTWRKK